MAGTLFSPLKIRSIEFRNRIAVSPMCMYSSEDGFAGDWHLVHLGSRAVGGAGLVLAEATAISPEGRITPHDLGIWKDAHIDFLKRITTFIDAHGAVPGIQLAHAGRKASHMRPWEGGQALPPGDKDAWQTLAPSPVPFTEDAPVPQALDEDGIRDIVQKFQESAVRALKAGFKVVEIHAAHGYLLHEFLSPLSNHRSDNYGGSFENRIRIVTEVAKSVREVWPEELPLFIRISVTDWKEGGWTADESVELAKVLKPLGIDLIDCSSGGNILKANIPVGPGYQVDLAGKVKKEGEVKTAAVGLITEAYQADEIIRDNKADMVFLARKLLRDPYFPLHAARELGVRIEWPVQYERGRD